MSFLSSIASKFGKPDEGGIGDDNSAVAAKDDNPYIAGPVVAARNAYDAMYSAVRWMVEGKRKSLKTIDAGLREWEREIDRIARQYEDLLKKIDNLAKNAEATFTLDLAREAWEIIQDSPELRRYMGEANYWYLHDTLGLLATQTGSVSAEISEGIKSALKAVVMAILSATDGLLQVESYYGRIAQYWGGLYQKMVPLPLTDSICPQVTCAYYYKPTHVTERDGYVLDNPVPGSGFSPIPLPLPNIETAGQYGLPSAFPDYQDPATWYVDGVNGTPWYAPTSMDLFWRSLNYWGSSYRDAVPPLVGIVYGQRDYTAREDGEHPLIVGKTFAQLDTSLTAISGGNTASSKISDILGEVFTEDVVPYLNEWQEAYEAMRDIVFNWAATNGINSVTDLYYATVGNTRALFALKAYLDSSADYRTARERLIGAWNGMVNASGTGSYAVFYKECLRVLQEVAHATGDLKGETVYAMPVPMALSTDPVVSVVDGVTLAAPQSPDMYGLRGMVTVTGWAASPTADYSDVFGVGRFILPAVQGFVMFPQDYTPAMYSDALWYPVAYMRQLSVLTNNVDIGVGEATATGESEILRYSYGTAWNASDTVGTPPLALSDPDACGVADPAIVGDRYMFCNLLFPDGVIVSDGSMSDAPDTFVTIYRKYATAYMASEELADEVGYSIREGRQVLFPCFGVYGEWLGMYSWEFREMPSSTFVATYARCRSGSDLYYEKAKPSHVVFRHSRYYSDTRSMSMTIYHEAIAHSERSAGEERYDFYVFPMESVSIGTHRDGDIDLGSLWPVNVTKDGVGYRYITMRNSIPKCPKYVDPEMWSFIDLVHELYFLAQSLSGLCADNGQRMKDLEDMLSAFGLEPPEFIGQLPADNGKHADYKFTIFQQYADRLRQALDNVYSLRDKIFRATENW